MTAPKKVKLKKYFISKDHEAVAEVMTECDGKEARTGFFCDEIPLDDDSICVVPYSSYLGLSVNKDNFITELKKNHDKEIQALKGDLEALVKLLNSVVKHTQDVQLEKNLEVYSLHEKIINKIKPIAEKLGLIKALSQKGGV